MYVQGESLKTCAALLVRLSNSPITRLGGDMTGSQEDRAAGATRHFRWTTLGSWLVGLLFMYRAVQAIAAGPGASPPGVPFAVLAGSLLLLPPLTTQLRKWIPPLRPLWAPPVAAFFLVAAVAIVSVCLTADPNPRPKAPSEQIAVSDERLGVYPAFAKKLISPRLKDPGSAQITDLIAYRTGAKLTLCGMVNAKNGFGGYVGSTPFIISDDGIYIGEGEATGERIEQECSGATRSVVPAAMLDN